MSNHHPDRNSICPVCQEVYAEYPATYCSKDCLNDAKRYRRRMDPVVQLFRREGFSARFENGVQLIMTMPNALRSIYPKSAWTFHFPAFFGEVNLFRAADLEGALCHWLGKDITRLFMELQPETHLDTYEISNVNSLLPIVSLKYNIESFLCETCHHAYVKTQYTFDEAAGVCMNCSVAGIPF